MRARIGNEETSSSSRLLCKRPNKFRHQYGIRPENCELLWVEFLCMDDLVIDRTSTGTPGSQKVRDKQRTRLKSESGKQLIVPLEPEHWLLDLDKVLGEHVCEKMVLIQSQFNPNPMLIQSYSDRNPIPI